MVTATQAPEGERLFSGWIVEFRIEAWANFPKALRESPQSKKRKQRLELTPRMLVFVRQTATRAGGSQGSAVFSGEPSLEGATLRLLSPRTALPA